MNSTYTIDFIALAPLFERLFPLWRSSCWQKQFDSILVVTDGSAEAFYTKVASHLPIIRRDFDTTAQAFAFLHRMHVTAHGNLAQFHDYGEATIFPDFIDAFLQSQALWDGIFDSALAECEQGRAAQWSSDAPKLFMATSSLLIACLRLCDEHYVDITGRLVTTWCRGKVFNLLETALALDEYDFQTQTQIPSTSNHT